MSADITRRSLTAAMALGPFLSIARAQGQRPVKVGTNNIYGVAATFPANGDDKPADGAIEIIRFNSVPAMLQALDAGELDVAEVGEVGPVVAQAAGIPIKIVAATQPWPEGEAIIVYKTSSIRSVKELVGKKVSYPRATNAQWLLTKALRAEGLKITDVVSVTLPAGTNILAVLETGGVDASVFIDASLSQYEAEGARRILNAARPDVTIRCSISRRKKPWRSSAPVSASSCGNCTVIWPGHVTIRRRGPARWPSCCAFPMTSLWPPSASDRQACARSIGR